MQRVSIKLFGGDSMMPGDIVGRLLLLLPVLLCPDGPSRLEYFSASSSSPTSSNPSYATPPTVATLPCSCVTGHHGYSDPFFLSLSLPLSIMILNQSINIIALIVEFLHKLSPKSDWTMVPSHLSCLTYASVYSPWFGGCPTGQTSLRDVERVKDSEMFFRDGDA